MKKERIAIMTGVMCCMLFSGCGESSETAPVNEVTETVQEASIEEKETSVDSKADKIEAEIVKSQEQAKPQEETTQTEEAEQQEDAKPLEETGLNEETHEIITAPEYNDIVDRLRKTDPVHPAETELLAQMASLTTFSKVIDTRGVVFSEMDNEQRAYLRRQILDAVMWGENAFYHAVEVRPADGKYDADSIISVEEASSLFKDIYGEKEFTPGEYEKVQDGNILISYGEGEPWHFVEHMQFFEDDDYFLLVGPAFYEDNGGEIDYLGCADILFEKNTDSRYGVTLLYGRYRDARIKVTSVETSSELKPSGSKTYSGMNLVDDDYTTVWSEGVPGTGLGETVTLHLDKKQPVYGIIICNGYTASYELYHNNGMLTDVDVDFGGKYAEGHELEGYGNEGFSAQNLADLNRSRIELEEPVETDTITIFIAGAKKGDKYDDTCVSEIWVYGTGSTDGTTAKDSGTNELIKYSYQNNPCSIKDPDTGTVICEGNYYTITLDEQSAEKYPRLKDSLNELNAAENERITNLITSNKEMALDMFAEGYTYAGFTAESELYPKRADSKAFSLALMDYEYAGGAHGAVQYYGFNYDPSTGERIHFSDVVRDTAALPQIIFDELIIQNKDLKGYFQDLPTDKDNFINGIPERLKNDAQGLAWALDYDGVWFYFEDYAMGSYAAGSQWVKVNFADYPDLFTDTYNNYKGQKLPDITDQAKQDDDAKETVMEP